MCRIPVLLWLGLMLAQAQHASHPGLSGPAPVLSGLGPTHHAISTRSPEAQRFFDQGLSLIYAFNHEEAVRAFERAASLDPACAMCWWGVAYAVGPNYNDPEIDSARLKIALDAVAKAGSLAVEAKERAYIDALSKRYTDGPAESRRQHAGMFRDAMRSLSARYADDLDAATLFAESAMNLKPWALYLPDGTPAAGTPEIVSVLESVLRRNPTHVGANHYYIHAVEASRAPERGLKSAKAFGANLAPKAGHLVHMPAHIYMRTGNYAAASEANRKAAEVDEEYMRNTGAAGMYTAMYYTHNLHFLAVSASIEGRSQTAVQAAVKTTSQSAPIAEDVAMAEFLVPTQALILTKLRRWEDVLAMARPPEKLPASIALWHFARGMARAAAAQGLEATKERDSLDRAAAQVPAGYPFNLNSAPLLIQIARAMLNAAIARQGGDLSAAIAHLQSAIRDYDRMAYDEPPGWYLPPRETLGAILIEAGRHPDAEQVFRRDLEQNPANARSLFGLAEALKREGRAEEGQRVWNQFRQAWANADYELLLSAF